MPTYGLGRLLNHDPRSRNFPAPTATTIKSAVWPVYGPRLNQGELGSCTGNAMAAWLNARPAHIPRSRYFEEPDAVRLYSRATQLDPFPGEMPGEDTGSDGNSICKAAREEGLITSWRHAFGFDHLLATLQVAPVLLGTNWYEGFFTPNSRGFIDIAGSVVGGHEYLVHGVNVPGQYLWGTQSWGPDWGLNGRFKIPFAVMRRLLAEDGDVVQPAR